MRERALADRGSYGDPHWTENTGLALDRKLLERMDRNNTWGCAVASQYPELIPFINVEPDLLAGDELANYVRNRVAEGARGVKLLPLQHHFHGNDRRLWPMYAYLEQVGLPVLSQSGHGGPASPLTGDSWGRPLYFGEAAAAFPKLRIILAHFGQGYVPDVLALAAQHEHIYFDTTAISSQIGVRPEWSIEQTMAIFRRVGAHHIVFGTNFPFSQTRERDAEAIDGLDLTEDEKRLIFYGNANGILHTGPIPAPVEAAEIHV
jgi:predicted TIM-barrel fold metal-dependent hydrolase